MSVIFNTLSKLINLINMGCSNTIVLKKDLIDYEPQDIYTPLRKKILDIEDTMTNDEELYFKNITLDIHGSIDAARAENKVEISYIEEQINELNEVLDIFRKNEYASTEVSVFEDLAHAKLEVTKIDPDVINLQNNIFYLFNLQQLNKTSILIEKNNPEDPIDTIKIYGNFKEITNFLHKKILFEGYNKIKLYCVDNVNNVDDLKTKIEELDINVDFYVNKTSWPDTGVNKVNKVGDLIYIDDNNITVSFTYDNKNFNYKLLEGRNVLYPNNIGFKITTSISSVNTYHIQLDPTETDYTIIFQT